MRPVYKGMELCFVMSVLAHALSHTCQQFPQVHLHCLPSGYALLGFMAVVLGIGPSTDEIRLVVYQSGQKFQ